MNIGFFIGLSVTSCLVLLLALTAMALIEYIRQVRTGSDDITEKRLAVITGGLFLVSLWSGLVYVILLVS